ncbi:MFS transporter [Amycolatopsis umgeniensis]|uniref:DHA2 family methylenomycin A resistance protein-like MFS transporter n=1 Tax=Amycolatopsis umgeniensis TaxID=336628 RepID=A0A841AU83_9PSEU|nr:MFS transporter [Amycolatopsis umgeniensis]MBB5850547.1 DHA2 family methylenomycin A resistance protein-like MFS transporter [Amycolatopsis umgeniensis]
MASTARERPVSTRRRLLLTVMCVGMFLVQLDVTIVNVALPQIAEGLETGLRGQQWVVDGYAVVLASLLLAGGTLGDRYGHKRVVLTGLGVFAAASLICGIAPGVATLIGGRALQGLGAAMLLPGTLAVVTRAFPERAEQARAVGVWAGVSALALPAGPLIGGALVSGVGWRAVFLINLPIIALAIPLTARLVTETSDEHPRPLDIPGILLATATLATTVYAVIAGEPLVLIATAVTLAGFLWWERRAAEPLLPLNLLRKPAFAGANVVAAAMNLVGIGTIFVATLYLQTVQHRDAFTAGLMLLPLFVPLAALAPVTGRLTGRYGPRPPLTCGLLIGAAGSLSMLGLRPDSGYLRLLPALLGLGIGMGLLTAAVVAAAIRSVPADRAGLASGVNNTARQAAGALAVAGYGAIAGPPADGAAFTSGLHTIGVLGAVTWMAALGLTWLTVSGRE